MGEHKPILRPSDLRRCVSEWVGQGFQVIIAPDGEVHVSPPNQSPADPFDLVDMKK